MKKNNTNGMTVKSSNGHTVDESSTRDIEFLRLTTDICYVIGGFFGGKFPDSESYHFMKDSGETVWLEIDKKYIRADDQLSRIELFALETIAKEHGFEFDIFTKED